MKTGKLRALGTLTSAGLMQKIYSKDIIALDSYTKLLIHGDSIGDATGKTVTAGGSAAVSSAQYKFSDLGTSIFLNGSTDFLSIADSPDWNFGSGDFTIDFFIKINALDYYQTIFYQSNGSVNDSMYLLYRRSSDAAPSRLDFNALVGGSDVFTFHTPNLIITDNNWHHIAIVRNGNTPYLFIDGIAKTLTIVISTGTIGDYTSNLNIGKDPVQNANYCYANLSGFRISKGIARWTSDFTPPTAPYDGARTILNIPNINGDVDKDYRLINKIVNGYNGDAYYELRFNGDNGTNYGREILTANNTSVSAVRQTTLTGMGTGSLNSLGYLNFEEYNISADSGKVRTSLVISSSRMTGVTVGQFILAGLSWNNTANNITSMGLFGTQVNTFGVGTHIELFALRE